MLSAFTFFFGLLVGFYWAYRRQEQIADQKEKKKLSEEIELRATPDVYLSDFDRIRKVYYEAKFKKMTGLMMNRKRIPMTEEEITLRKASQKQ